MPPHPVYFPGQLGLIFLQSAEPPLLERTALLVMVLVMRTLVSTGSRCQFCLSDCPSLSSFAESHPVPEHVIRWGWPFTLQSLVPTEVLSISHSEPTDSHMPQVPKRNDAEI